MFKSRTKLEKLLCLKCVGRTWAAKTLALRTAKEVPEGVQAMRSG
jgi:hypothetical protein